MGYKTLVLSTTTIIRICSSGSGRGKQSAKSTCIFLRRESGVFAPLLLAESAFLFERRVVAIISSSEQVGRRFLKAFHTFRAFGSF